MQSKSGQTKSSLFSWWLIAVTAATMGAFATNSLLTRLAFQTTTIDPVTFTSVRLISGAVILLLINGARGQRPTWGTHGWLSAILLFMYATAFSFAYRGLDTGTGALVLFASAQLLMVGVGYIRGERTNLWGVALALAGLVVFLAPSDSAPPLGYAALMLVAGMAWGGFSLAGRADASPMLSTMNSFLLTVPLTLILLWLNRYALEPNTLGIIYAMTTGCVTSALGYVVWYWVRVRMTAITAGTVQLSVPILSAILGVLILDETLSTRNVIAALVVLLGIGLTTRRTRAVSNT